MRKKNDYRCILVEHLNEKIFFTFAYQDVGLVDSVQVRRINLVKL